MLGFVGHGVEFETTEEAMFCPYDFKRRLATDANKKELYSANGKTKLLEPHPDSLIGMSAILNGLKLAKFGNRFLLAVTKIAALQLSPERLEIILRILSIHVHLFCSKNYAHVLSVL